jgi:hypothetical protein
MKKRYLVSLYDIAAPSPTPLFSITCPTFSSTQQTLKLFLHTNSALHPAGRKKIPMQARVPGITRRDLRLAILLEQSYDQYYHDGRALEPQTLLC